MAISPLGSGQLSSVSGRSGGAARCRLMRRRKRVAQGVLIADDAVAALDAVADLQLEFVSGPQRWGRSLRAALDGGVTTYDALYVLLALDLDADLATADARLADSARRRSLPVRPPARLMLFPAAPDRQRGPPL